MNHDTAAQPELDADFFAQAQAEARRFGHAYVRTEHLLLALLGQADSAAAQRLQAAGISYAAFAAQAAGLRYPVCGAAVTLELAEGAKRAVLAAHRIAGSTTPDSLALLKGILQVSPLVRGLLADAGHKSIELIQD